MIVSTQEVASQSPEHLEKETCPTSSEEVNEAIYCRTDFIDSSCQITILAPVAQEEDFDKEPMVSFWKLWEAFENQSDIIEFQA